MILSRAKPAIQNENTDKEKSGSAKKQVPTIEQFLEKRDYTGDDYGMREGEQWSKWDRNILSPITFINIRISNDYYDVGLW